MTRREMLLSAGLVFVVALVVARDRSPSQIVFPKPEDTAYYVGVARNLLEGRGLVSDALWSYQTPPLVFPRPAFEVWLPLPTFLAAIPMALLGATFAAAQVLVGPRRRARAGPRLAARRRRRARSAACPIGRARTLAIGTGLTSAVYLPLLLHSRPARLDDAVRRPRPRRLPADDPDRARPARRAADRSAGHRPRRPHRARRADPQRGGLARADLGRGRLAAPATDARGAGPADRRRRRSWPLLVFAPWAIRDWVVFGSPLPGQAVANALSVTGFDIFAWNDPPTLSRYLAVGPARLLEMRVEGIGHNLFTVLLLPGAADLAHRPPRAAVAGSRSRAVRPVVILGLVTFLVTSLVFPVATTWGTFLHAAGPVHVLLVLSALLALDAGIARLGVRLGWTRPVAWLGPLLGIFGSVLFSVALLPAFGAGSRGTAERYEELARRMAAIGHPLDASAGPVITNFPIWLAETPRRPGPRPARRAAERRPRPRPDPASPAPGSSSSSATTTAAGRRSWTSAGPGADCFRELDLGPGPAGATDPLADVRVFEIVCP